MSRRGPYGMYCPPPPSSTQFIPPLEETIRNVEGWNTYLKSVVDKAEADKRAKPKSRVFTYGEVMFLLIATSPLTGIIGNLVFSKYLEVLRKVVQ